MIHQIKQYFYFSGNFFYLENTFQNDQYCFLQSTDLTHFVFVPGIPVQYKKANRKNISVGFFLPATN